MFMMWACLYRSIMTDRTIDGDQKPSTVGMNSILSELGKAGVRHEATRDVFLFSSQLFDNFRFLFQNDESELRQLELAASLFDHITVECVNNIVSLVRDTETHEAGRGTGSKE